MKTVKCLECIVRPTGEVLNFKQPDDLEDIAAITRNYLAGKDREHMMVYYLSQALEIIGYSIVSIGIANSVHSHPREIFKAAIVLGATHIIIAHNHPSGNLTPSPSDCELLKKVKYTGDVIGIECLAGILVTDNECMLIEVQQESEPNSVVGEDDSE